MKLKYQSICEKNCCILIFECLRSKNFWEQTPDLLYRRSLLSLAPFDQILDPQVRCAEYKNKTDLRT